MGGSVTAPVEASITCSLTPSSARYGVPERWPMKWTSCPRRARLRDKDAATIIEAVPERWSDHSDLHIGST